MLKDMGHPGGILWHCPEKHPKGIFTIFVGNVNMPGLCPLVNQFNEEGVNGWQGTNPIDDISVDFPAFLKRAFFHVGFPHYIFL